VQQNCFMIVSHNKPEQNMLNTAAFADSQKANVDALLGMANTAFAGMEQLAALNLKVARSSLDQAADAATATLAAKDPQSLLALQAGLLQPNAEKALAYGREVAGIFSATKAQFDKAASEQAVEAQNAFMAAVDAATKNAPEGAANGMAMFKSAFSAANNALDSVQQAARQATEAAQANYTAMTATAAKAAGKAKRA
jgi:phasin family protein